MPRAKRRCKTRRDYSDQERRVLLTGVPIHPGGTRFGHPFRGGWNIPAIAEAWSQLEDELLDEWESEAFDRHREQHDRPFAVRILDGEF